MNSIQGRMCSAAFRNWLFLSGFGMAPPRAPNESSRRWIQLHARVITGCCNLEDLTAVKMETWSNSAYVPLANLPVCRSVSVRCRGRHRSKPPMAPDVFRSGVNTSGTTSTWRQHQLHAHRIYRSWSHHLSHQNPQSHLRSPPGCGHLWPPLITSIEPLFSFPLLMDHPHHLLQSSRLDLLQLMICSTRQDLHLFLDDSVHPASLWLSVWPEAVRTSSDFVYDAA